MLTAVIRSSLGKHEMAFRARSLALRRGYRMAGFERTCSLVSFHNTAVHTRPCQYLAFFGPSERSRLTFFLFPFSISTTNSLYISSILFFSFSITNGIFIYFHLSISRTILLILFYFYLFLCISTTILLIFFSFSFFNISSLSLYPSLSPLSLSFNTQPNFFYVFLLSFSFCLSFLFFLGFSKEFEVKQMF